MTWKQYFKDLIMNLKNYINRKNKDTGLCSPDLSNLSTGSSYNIATHPIHFELDDLRAEQNKGMK